MREGVDLLRGRKSSGIDFETVAQMMRAAGFVDVVCRHFKMPSGRWLKEPRFERGWNSTTVCYGREFIRAES
jgi:hypothetical protein